MERRSHTPEPGVSKLKTKDPIGGLMKYLLSLLIAFFLLVNCGSNPFGSTMCDVKYKVTGTAATVDVTIENEDGGCSQFSDVSVPWTYSFEREEGEFVYVSAQNCGNSGSVTVTIYKDGDTFKTSTSSGAYVIATASGTL